MDASSFLVFMTFVASMLIVGDLAQGLGRKQSRWIWIAAAIGPLAIPALYLAVAISAFRKRTNAQEREARNSLRVGKRFSFPIKLIWVVQSPLAKIFRWRRRANQGH
jgi:hypothetical protein